MHDSQNHKWLAYEQYIFFDPPNDNLVVRDIFGEKLFILPWKDEWSGIVAWLDHDHLIINLLNTKMVNEENKLLILNPFTGEREYLKSEYPGISPLNSNPIDWNGWGTTVYNASLDRVIYLRSEDGYSSYEYVLWDIHDSAPLASINLVGSINQTPRWAPSKEDQFVLAISYYNPPTDIDWPVFELYSIDRDGAVKQLTQLSTYYNWVSISDYSWSPDGNKIAFWFSSGEEDISGWDKREQYLAVVDLECGMVTNYCIPGNYSAQVGQGGIIVPPPLWSPDGKQLVVVNRYDEEDHNRVILVDLETEQAYKIADNAIPVGWLLANP